MYYWLIFYIPAMAIAVNLPTLINRVFVGSNLDVVDKCYHYLDMEAFEMHTIGYRRGQRENLLGLLYTIAMIVLIVLAFFLSNKWWMALIAFAGGNVFRFIRSFFGKLHYGTFLYYLELLIEPVLLFFAYYFLISAHNPYI